jgi:hypothetical protein
MLFAEAVDLSDLWIMFFRTFLPQVPLVLVCLLGLILAGIRWRRHLRVSLFAGLGCALLLVSSVVGSLAFGWAQHRMMTGTAAEVGALFTLIGIMRSLVNTAGFVFLLLAIFSGRELTVIPLPDASDHFCAAGPLHRIGHPRTKGVSVLIHSSSAERLAVRDGSGADGDQKVNGSDK